MSTTDENTIKIVTRNDSINDPEKVVAPEQGPINIQIFLQKYMKIKSQVAKEFIGEVLGTLLLVFIGCSGVAQFKFSGTPVINFFSVNIAFGFGAIVAILLVGKVSGAHLNPAVSFAMLLTGRMTFLRFFVYCIAQFVGAFLGAFLVFIVYLDALKQYKNGMYSLDSAGIFATYPNPTLSTFGGFLDQVVGTAILIMAVLAITDKKNVEMPPGTIAIMVGIILIVIGATLGHNCGYAINPARDFGPRLFTLIAGWDAKVFTASNYFFWIPIVGPMVGSLFATLIYLILISNNF